MLYQWSLGPGIIRGLGVEEAKATPLQISSRQTSWIYPKLINFAQGTNWNQLRRSCCRGAECEKWQYDLQGSLCHRCCIKATAGPQGWERWSEEYFYLTGNTATLEKRNTTWQTKLSWSEKVKISETHVDCIVLWRENMQLLDVF